MVPKKTYTLNLTNPKAIHNYINVYNFQRCHSAIGNVPPAERYFPALLLNAARAVA